MNRSYNHKLKLVSLDLDKAQDKLQDADAKLKEADERRNDYEQYV